jgi:hypothetical protein
MQMQAGSMIDVDVDGLCQKAWRATPEMRD